jgi:nucleoside-diphosphate-sugar epimerase
LAGLNSASGDIICNLSKSIPNLSNYDLVIHAAGKAHSVAKTQEQKKEFFDINVTGTVNLLKGLKQG